jgi:hypothetical protein
MVVVSVGERFQDKQTKKIYVVNAVEKREVMLVGENGRGRRLTTETSLKHTCEKLQDTMAASLSSN